jgi:hypothetical protein
MAKNISTGFTGRRRLFRPCVGIGTNLHAQIMTSKKRKTATIPVNLIAPCGMDCRLCLGYIREKNTCPGCRMIDKQDSKKSEYCNRCRIRNCEPIANGKVKYCSDSCGSFPCARLKQLDKRYQTRYGMSMMDNLIVIDELGIRHFIQNEKKVSVHRAPHLLCCRALEV